MRLQDPVSSEHPTTEAQLRTAWEECEVSPWLCHFRLYEEDLKGIQDNFSIIKIVFDDLEKGLVWHQIGIFFSPN